MTFFFWILWVIAVVSVVSFCIACTRKDRWDQQLMVASFFGAAAITFAVVLIGVVGLIEGAL